MTLEPFIVIDIDQAVRANLAFPGLIQMPEQDQTIVLDQIGKIGKGNGVKTIFIKAEEVRADAVALIDGDLTSVKPEWLKYLIKPILEGYDLVSPFYFRHKYDGVITNHLAYPLTRALYGVSIRQPIGGEYGLSNKIINKVLIFSDIFYLTHYVFLIF